MADPSKLRNTIQSVSRAIEILKLFETNDQLGVTDISRITGLHKSTAFGLIATLEAHHLLEKNGSTDKYGLGMAVFRLGTRVNAELRQLSFPYLERLLAAYGETVNLVLLEYPHAVYMEKIESAHSMRISTAIGEARPLYCTAVGKSLLAFMDEGQLEHYLATVPLVRHTPHTITEPDVLKQQLAQARKAGYAHESEELEPGLSCVAAPVRNHMGRPFAAISISGPVSRMDALLREQIGARVSAYAMELSAGLGWRAPR